MAQNTIALYPGEIPGSKPTENKERTEITDSGITIVHNITRPTLSIFLPPKGKASDVAVIIVPGGGYGINASVHEGSDVAKKLNELGIAAFVLKYRIPTDETMTDRKVGPLQDAQQAIAYVRKNAKQFAINPDKIGILGFSAGGHLAATAGTHFEKPVLKQDVSVRPDFMILVYPVISMLSKVTHSGSRDNLLGKTPTQSDLELFSNELQVTTKTPPTFLVHASDDDAVPVENSILFYQAVQKNNIPCELHIYSGGGHGFGLVNETTKDLWMDRCRNWLSSIKLLQ